MPPKFTMNKISTCKIKTRSNHAVVWPWERLTHSPHSSPDSDQTQSHFRVFLLAFLSVWNIPLRALDSWLLLIIQIFFFYVDHLKSLYWICYNIVSVLWFWCFGHEACEILVPRPQIKPSSSALESEVLTTVLPESPSLFRFLLWCLFSAVTI